MPEKILIGLDGQPLDPLVQEAVRRKLPRLRRLFPRLRDEAVFDNIADLAAQKLAAYRIGHQVRDPDALAWTILRRAASTVLRTKGTNLEPELLPLPPDDRISVSAPGARTQAESWRLLSELLMSLTPRERAIHLARAHGYHSSEIAKVHDISEANVDTIFSRAKKKLAKLASPVHYGPTHGDR